MSQSDESIARVSSDLLVSDDGEPAGAVTDTVKPTASNPAVARPPVILTGMVLCPQRFSHVGVMRCAEYQSKRNCGFGCPHGVNETEIQVVLSRSAGWIDVKESIAPAVCIDCHRPKKSTNGPRCNRCGGKVGAARRRDAAGLPAPEGL